MNIKLYYANSQSHIHFYSVKVQIFSFYNDIPVQRMLQNVDLLCEIYEHKDGMPARQGQFVCNSGHQIANQKLKKNVLVNPNLRLSSEINIWYSGTCDRDVVSLLAFSICFVAEYAMDFVMKFSA